MHYAFNTLQSHINRLEADKKEILETWISFPLVRNTLTCKMGMQPQFFSEYFGSKIIDYAFSVIKNENRLGDCPVIGVMLTLFKRKAIALSDVFLVCVHLKNALLHYLLTHDLLSTETLAETNRLMDYNFEGVIKEYVYRFYGEMYAYNQEPMCDRNCSADHTCSERQPVLIPEDITVASEHLEIQKTSATDYAQEVQVDSDIIAELDEIEMETMDAISATDTFDAPLHQRCIAFFEDYSKMLNQLLEFQELAYTVTVLISVLENQSNDSLDSELQSHILIYLRSIVSDLQSWRMSVFVTHEAEDIHYLDKTLMSAIAQLQIMLMPQSQSAEDDDIEFF